MTGENKKVDLTTGIGTLSFPRIFEDTKGKKDDGVTDTYDVQIIIPKTQKEDLKAIVRAIREVGMAKWGANYTKFGLPLRDGDKEADDLTDDGKTTKGEKYPERLGCYFMNARSSKPVSVVGRDRTPIVNSGEVYGGCKAKINVTFYVFNAKGNQGIAAGLNGVQFIAHGEPFGTGAPTVDSMFDILDDADDSGLDGDEGADPYGLDESEATEEVAEVEVVKPPAKKAAAKKAPAKKAAAPAQTPAQKAAAAKLALAKAEAEAAEAEAAAAEAGDEGDADDPDAMLGDSDADSLYEDLDDSDS